MRDTVTKKPRGFGFITFADPETANAVCEEQHQLDGRQVSKEREGRNTGQKLEITQTM